MSLQGPFSFKLPTGNKWRQNITYPRSHSCVWLQNQNSLYLYSYFQSLSHLLAKPFNLSSIPDSNQGSHLKCELLGKICIFMDWLSSTSLSGHQKSEKNSLALGNSYQISIKQTFLVICKIQQSTKWNLGKNYNT